MLFEQKLGQTNVTTLVERVSRFTVILKNPNRRTKPVMGKIKRPSKTCPILDAVRLLLIVETRLPIGPIFRLKLGYQRGSVIHPLPLVTSLRDTRSVASNTCKACVKGAMHGKKAPLRAQSPRQRWLPRKRDIRVMSDHDIKEISDRLNSTPRKGLGWKTPAKVFREKMLEEMR